MARRKEKETSSPGKGGAAPRTELELEPGDETGFALWKQALPVVQRGGNAGASSSQCCHARFLVKTVQALVGSCHPCGSQVGAQLGPWCLGTLQRNGELRADHAHCVVVFMVFYFIE